MPLMHVPVRLKWTPAMDVHIKQDNVDELWIPYLQGIRMVAGGI